MRIIIVLITTLFFLSGCCLYDSKESYQGHCVGEVSLEDRKVVCDNQVLWDNREFAKDFTCVCYSPSKRSWDACWTFPVTRECTGKFPVINDSKIEYADFNLRCEEKEVKR